MACFRIFSRLTLLAAIACCLLAAGASAVGIAPRVAVAPASAATLPQISGEEVVGGKLTSTTGSWSWTPSSYSFQWLLCNSQGQKCHAISGLTSQTIVVPTAAANLCLRVKVTATAPRRTGSATSKPTGLIAPQPAAPPTEELPPTGEGTTPPPTEEPPPPQPAEGELFREGFNYPDGLITNEYATWNPGSAEATTSPIWEMTSGSLFAQNGSGWTGVPDGCSSASASSIPCTASDVFRLNTKRSDFGDVTVSLDLRNNYLTSSSRTPAVAWDGVHVWLRYQSEYNLYYASFNRRDGHIVIKKKCAGGSENGGTYYELGVGELSGFPIPFGVWQHLAARVHNNADGSVTITMWRDGAQLLSATDNGVGCAPIRAPGSVGVRGDNDDFNIDNFVVTSP